MSKIKGESSQEKFNHAPRQGYISEPSSVKDYLLEREGHDIDLLLETTAGIDGYFDGEEFISDREKAKERIKSFQAETVRGVLERVREGCRKLERTAWDSGLYNRALSDVLSLLDTNEK